MPLFQCAAEVTGRAHKAGAAIALTEQLLSLW